MSDNIKNNLRKVRQGVGISVSELARRSNTSRQTITNIELRGQDPSATLALAIAKVLKTDPYEIFFTHDVIHELQNPKEVS